MEMEIKNVEVIEQQDNEKGASMLEYALLAALIAVVCIVVVQLVGQGASRAFSNVGSAITQ